MGTIILAGLLAAWCVGQVFRLPREGLQRIDAKRAAQARTPLGRLMRLAELATLVALAAALAHRLASGWIR